ncbi:hypothetical protein, partial [Chromobacterium vaccinii]|uniref:hypothetical protein n=1 Tax=Chromobacterium vaccinii TaxID=1108595 RepID=UPI001186B6BB
MSKSSVGRRISACLREYQAGNYEESLIHFFPALDKVSKRRRPSSGVGERIRGFIRDEEILITAISLRVAMKGNRFDGVTLEEAIYKFGRTSIVHEGELDPRLKFVQTGGISIGKEWVLPISFILALIIAVLSAKECRGEEIDINEHITILDRTWHVNSLIGNAPEIKTHVAAAF